MVSMTISLREDVYDRLREYCKRNKVKPSHVIAKLIEIALPILFQFLLRIPPELLSQLLNMPIATFNSFSGFHVPVGAPESAIKIDFQFLLRIPRRSDMSTW